MTGSLHSSTHPWCRQYNPSSDHVFGYLSALVCTRRCLSAPPIEGGAEVKTMPCTTGMPKMASRAIDFSKIENCC